VDQPSKDHWQTKNSALAVVACEKGLVNDVKLKGRAEVSSINWRGLSALDSAAEKDHGYLVMMLKAAEWVCIAVPSGLDFSSR
jgi:hypothetical protein